MFVQASVGDRLFLFFFTYLDGIVHYSPFEQSSISLE